jgi:hypothetical protein
MTEGLGGLIENKQRQVQKQCKCKGKGKMRGFFPIRLAQGQNDKG